MRREFRPHGVRTPWGLADGATEYGEGVIFYETPSHGGFKLDADQNRKVASNWRAASFNGQANKGGWYEEHCDWCMVALTFPSLFSAENVAAAQHTFDYWIKPKLAGGPS